MNVETRFKFGLVSMVLAILIAACGPSRPEVDTVLPTRTPRPTFTATPQPAAPPVAAVAEATATPTIAPAAAAEEPSATPTSADVVAPEPDEARAVVTSPRINLRSGPGTVFQLLGEAARGDEFQIVGKNPAGDWWQLCCLNEQIVWAAAFLVDTFGPVDSVAVPANLPVPPTQPPTPVPAPAQPTNTPAPAAPTLTPAPAFLLVKASFVEPRFNNNGVVTFFGTICKEVCPGGGPVGGLKLVVEGPHGRSEGVFEEIFRHGDPGLASEFIYNVKVEIPGGPAGTYRAYVVNSGGEQVGEAWEYSASGNTRTFLPRWIAP